MAFQLNEFYCDVCHTPFKDKIKINGKEEDLLCIEGIQFFKDYLIMEQYDAKTGLKLERKLIFNLTNSKHLYSFGRKIENDI